MLKFRTYKEFSRYLEKIDLEMRNDKVPIFARPIQAFSRISIANGSMEFDITEAMKLNLDQLEGYEGNVLTRKIIIWFEDIYGDLLKIRFRFGKSVALVRGDPYLMVIPFNIGDVRLAYDIKTLGKTGSIDQNGETIVNVFDHLIGVTRATVDLAWRDDGVRLIGELAANTQRFRLSDGISDYENVFDVRKDLEYSADHLVSDDCNFGLSRWHSLQAAEKALKSVLSCQGLNFPTTHNLYELVHVSAMHGISSLALDSAMCSSSVRYEAGSSTLMQAINAHHASLDICSAVAERIAEVGKLKIDQRPQWARELDEKKPLECK